MGTVTTIGIDLAKNSFAVHGMDERGCVVLRKTLRRDKVSLFFSNVPPCLVGMEACAGSAYWQRVIAGHGHTVRRMHARFVAPYRTGDKNDANDAAASNQARGLLGECGIVVRQGARHLVDSLPVLLVDQDNGLSGVMRRMLVLLSEHIASLEAQIGSLNQVLQDVAKEQEACGRLLKVPGVGVLGATLLLAVSGAAKEFRNGRQFAAYLGLVPRQRSTGGKPRLLGITKRGDSYVRTVLIHGARAVLAAMRRGFAPLGSGAAGVWLMQLVARRGPNKACVALANKMARIAWSMLAKGAEYRPATA